MNVPVELVVAVADNGVIGADGAMPWHLSTDLKRFRGLTMGRPMIMGRKTFESIGRPLPGRTSIVVTRNRDWHHEGVLVAFDTQSALDEAQAVAASTGATSVVVLGGAEIFEQVEAERARLHLTRVHASPEGDTFFPVPQEPEWTRVFSEKIAAGPNDTAETTYEVWERS